MREWSLVWPTCHQWGLCVCPPRASRLVPALWMLCWMCTPMPRTSPTPGMALPTAGALIKGDSGVESTVDDRKLLGIYIIRLPQEISLNDWTFLVESLRIPAYYKRDVWCFQSQILLLQLKGEQVTCVLVAPFIPRPLAHLAAFPDSENHLLSSANSHGINVYLSPKDNHVTLVGCKQMDVFVKSNGYFLPTKIPIRF